MWSGGKQGEQVHAGAVSTFFIQEKNWKQAWSKARKILYTRNKAKSSTFSSFQHDREFALKSKTPVPVKATPEDKAMVTVGNKTIAVLKRQERQFILSQRRRRSTSLMLPSLQLRGFKWIIFDLEQRWWGQICKDSEAGEKRHYSREGGHLVFLSDHCVLGCSLRHAPFTC